MGWFQPGGPPGLSIFPTLAPGGSQVLQFLQSDQSRETQEVPCGGPVLYFRENTLGQLSDRMVSAGERRHAAYEFAIGVAS